MSGAEASRRRSRRHAPARHEGGFSLVEILVATSILMLIVISLSNLLVDSLAAALLARQREAAASLASDTVENAKALGLSALAGAGSATCTSCTGTGVQVLDAADFESGYTTNVDGTSFTVQPTVSPVTGGPDNVSVTVTWDHDLHRYFSTTQIGT